MRKEKKKTEKEERMSDVCFFEKEDFEEKTDIEQEILEEEPEDKHGDYSFSEYGIGFSADRKAVEAFAKAVCRNPEEVMKIYENGCRFEKIMKELEEAKRDSEIFEKLAKMRGISKSEMKAEIFGAIETAEIEKAAKEIREANPGMNRETAEELARFRIKSGKPEKREEKKDRMEKLEAMLREMEIFAARHREIENLDDSVIEEWEKGIPLEKAYFNYSTAKEKEELLEKIKKMELEKEKNERKAYAKEHSTGSATSAEGLDIIDAFVEGLFKEY